MYKILLCDETIHYLQDNGSFPCNVDIATNEDEIYSCTYEHNYDLYVVNFYFYDIFATLQKTTNDTTKIVFIDEVYNLFNLQKLLLDDLLSVPITL